MGAWRGVERRTTKPIPPALLRSGSGSTERSRCSVRKSIPRASPRLQLPRFTAEGRPVVPLPERRRASRIPTALTGRLIRPDGSACALEVEGLSIVGLHGRSAAPVARDVVCRIELLTDTGGIDVRGTVVRSLECELAIRFD